MKRLICIILVVLMCFGITLSVSAEYQMSKWEEKIIPKVVPIHTVEPGEYFYEEIYEHYSSPDADIPNYVFVFAAHILTSRMVHFVEDYFVVEACCYPIAEGYCIYVPQEDKLYTLEEALNANIEGVEEVFCRDYMPIGKIGDVDGDNLITVKDASMLQKCLANIKTDNPYLEITPELMDVWFYAKDYDRDNTVTIKDASAIQKAIAGLDPSAPDIEE